MSRYELDTVERLELFLARVSELESTRLLRGDFASRWTLKFDRMQGLSFSSQEPDEDDLRSFLLTFRQFVSEREPVFLNGIFNVCQQHLMSDELKGYLIAARESWKRSQQSNYVQLIFNDREITPEYVADLWINGWYFHNDVDKRRKIERLLPHERLMVRHHFLSFLIDATRQVIYVAHVIKFAQGQRLIRLE